MTNVLFDTSGSKSVNLLELIQNCIDFSLVTFNELNESIMDGVHIHIFLFVECGLNDVKSIGSDVKDSSKDNINSVAFLICKIA
jgi:hypothetical protein